MPDQPVELVEPTRPPSAQPSSPPDDEAGPRVVTPAPSVPLSDDDPDDPDDGAEDAVADGATLLADAAERMMRLVLVGCVVAAG